MNQSSITRILKNDVLLLRRRYQYSGATTSNHPRYVLGYYNNNNNNNSELLDNNNNNYCSIENRKQQQQQPNTSIRLYHTTSRQEIIPLIGLAAVVLIGRYTWRAQQRMKDEYDEYQYQLQQYEKYLQRNAETVVTLLPPTIGIDYGTIYTKLASNKPTSYDIMITSTGDRYTFNGIVYDKDNDIVAKGKSALERYHSIPATDDSTNSNSNIVLPFPLLALGDDTKYSTKVVHDTLESNIKDVIDRIQSSVELPPYNTPVPSSPIRNVITIPVSLIHRADTYRSIFEKSLSHDNTQIISLVPDPIASIWGAQIKNLLPSSNDNDEGDASSTTKVQKKTKQKRSNSNILVIDVGGFITQVSVIQNETMIVQSHTIPWGGETFIELALQQLIKDSNEEISHDSRTLASLQYHTRMAVAEMSTPSKSRVSVHIPYLFTSDPKKYHYDGELSRAVLQQAIHNDIQENLQDVSYLSPNLPLPSTIESLWVSVLTSVLEQSNIIPTAVDHILVVGGGSKFIPVVDSLKSALYMIMGPDSTSSKRLIVPDMTLRPELTVLGATTLLPSYDYSIPDGKLIRRSS